MQCCYAPGCIWVKNGLCPGDDSVKCTPSGYCWNMGTGECPGGPQFRTPISPYKENGQYVKCYQEV